MKALVTFAVFLVLAVDTIVLCGSKCKVSEWSLWHVVPNPDLTDPGLTFDVEEKTGQGRSNRYYEEYGDLWDQCEDGEFCALYDNRTSEGRVDCVNDTANDLTCNLIDQLSFVSVGDLAYDPAIEASPTGNDLWGWVDPVDSREYVLVGLTSGTSFVDITDPENPIVVGHLTTHGNDRACCRDIKVINSYAYIVSELPDHGLQVFNLDRLRTVTNPPERFTEDGHYDGVGNCHNLFAHEELGLLYAMGCDKGNYTNICQGGLHILDVNPDPTNLTFVTCFGGDSYVHDTQCVIYAGPDVTYAGREICFCYNEEYFTVCDVTDKQNIDILSKRNYTDTFYVHQGWLTADQSVIVADDELDEINTSNKLARTIIWDVSDLDNPIVANEWRSTVRAVDHDQYIVGEYVYQANCRAGLRMLWLDQANRNLTEVAYFDTHPGEDVAMLGGAWSPYPFFPSGNIAVNTWEYGLFIVRPRYPEIQQIVDNLKQTKTQMSRYRVIVETEDERSCPTLRESKYV